ncbi:MAG TPA: ATP-dependent DNA helicase [Jiangellaceae bacterium]
MTRDTANPVAVNTDVMSHRFDPAELAGRLGLPPPTPEQARAISAPMSPGVIVAGAGSGKTETMAARVVWLVANGLVRPEQVLGLTFTRKAARELAARLRRRLAQLRARGLMVEGGTQPGVRGTASPAGELGDPTVLTYDAFAGRVVSEHAVRLGREPGARLITEAVAWQFATRVVESYDGPMNAVGYAPSTVADKVLSLHGELAGHLVEPARLGEFAADLRARVDALPPVPRMKGRYYADVAKALDVQDARAQLVPIVERFRAVKAEHEAVDFADQAELAATLAASFPEVGATERDRFAVVLLDEYQDTSHAQLVLLRELFGAGHPVTAVGDPCQSIYGWRGASSETLTSFGREFPAKDGASARLDSLTTSFRNGASILAVANRLAEPLRAEGLDVPVLTSHGSEAGAVVACLHSTVDDEAADIARRARACWDEAGGDDRPSIAVLVRNRAQIARIDRALRAAGLPVEVVGVGGLLMTPEVADIVATLRVLSDPSRGDALMRLLTGARWRIGPRDLDALGRAARRLAAGHGSEGVVEADEVDESSIVDALDALSREDAFSPEGYRRLAALAGELRGLRRRLDQPLPELVHDVERTLGLTVEVTARADETGRANLDRFLEVAAEFAGSAEAPTLAAFLAYLDAAETAERGLRPGEVEVSGDRVQVLTVHGAKGLEWDVVFVAGLVDTVFPAGGERDRAWLGDPGELPHPLRGDGGALPALGLDGAANQRDVRDAVAALAEQCGAAGRIEERRLAYVAVTRARRLLVCSGAWWGDGRSAREPSEFLAEISMECERGAGQIGVWVDKPGDTNPLAETAVTYTWPYDPLGSRRAVVAEGAQMVRAAMDRTDAHDLLDEAAITEAAEEWAEEVDVLIAERERRRPDNTLDVELPRQLSVSQLVTLRGDAGELARAIRRPVPRPPAPLARRGTLFHAWLETRWGAPRLVDPDELPGSADAGAAADSQLAALQDAFLRSEWAQHTPVEVEAPFELLLGGVVVRGRADAVFEAPDGRIDVIDWKTGQVPREAELASVHAVQLAAYRLAFAKLRGVPLEQVGAAFHYVSANKTIRPVDLLDEAGLERLLP